MNIISKNEELELQKIDIFRKGYPAFLENMNMLANGISTFLMSGQISEQSKKELIPIRKSIDTELQNIQQFTRKITFEIDNKNLEPVARKDFYSFFPNGKQDSQMLEFLIFFKTFEHLRDYFLIVGKSWNIIRNAIFETNFSDKNFKSEQLISYRILPAMDRMEALKTALVRMARLLSISDADRIFEQKAIFKPNYNKETTYKLSSLFLTNFETQGSYNVMDDLDLSEVKTPSPKIPTPTEKSFIEKQEKSKSSPSFLNAGGKMTWNNNSHYFIQYDAHKAEEERQLFANTLKADTHIGAEEERLKSDLIRKISSKEFKTRSKELVEQEYMNFLEQYFNFCIDITALNIGIQPQLKNIFIFHLGPSHFYMLVKKFLIEANTGFLHVRSSDGKKVTKIIPGELIKKRVLQFWESAILPKIGEEKNNLTALKKIIEKVEIKYKEISLHTIEMYDQLPLDVKASKPRAAIFREKMSEWMGATNIIVFKRFLKVEL
ncbi:MAG: hypothetical protein L6Q54_10030 [Leptospiraceae bacterium]|nr:hypothetical protein [Leptospiraceae bacterium]MCK6381565.1 hypothetical protein [Leptospiraceae bacterium]NUM41672.1 hypothetical protein [Leptospiraceae bacterium]